MFFREVHAAWRYSESVDDRPDFQTHAEMATSLARFLQGRDGMPPPMPTIPNLTELVFSLEGAAMKMSRQAKLQIPVSRERSRRRTDFIRNMNTLLMDMCGAALHQEAAVLVDIAFPEQETTVDQIRSALRPSTRMGRSGKKRQ